MTPPPDPAAFVEERLGTSRPLKAALRYIFPDHWSFLLGEMALYSFLILIATGVFLALNFDPSTTLVTWHGPYAPLDGARVSSAYASALDLSFKVPAGLLLRQTHHWAALLFMSSITIHLLRIVFTGAFRKPRELNHVVGVTLLVVGLLEGFAGYSLLDDLLSGSGLAIGYGVALSIPGVGGALGALIWDGPFPGGSSFLPRLYIAHVFIFPAVLATLIGGHLAMIMRQHHAQFRGPGRRESNVVGSPMWPAYALRSAGWLAATAAVLLLLGGLVQINPIFQWGPFEPYLTENGAQPDWYLGWLIGALRLMPGFDVNLFGRTLIPNPFWGGILFPGVIFGIIYTLPWLDRLLFTGDDRSHHLLDRPRDNPRRSAFAGALFALVTVVFAFGAADRVFLSASIDYALQLWMFRALLIVAPVVVYSVTFRWCRALAAQDAHPLRGVQARVLPGVPPHDDERPPVAASTSVARGAGDDGTDSDGEPEQ